MLHSGRGLFECLIFLCHFASANAYTLLYPKLPCPMIANYSINSSVYSIFLNKADFLRTNTDVDQLIQSVFDLWASRTLCHFVRDDQFPLLTITTHYDVSSDLAYYQEAQSIYEPQLRGGSISINTDKTFCLTTEFMYLFYVDQASTGYGILWGLCLGLSGIIYVATIFPYRFVYKLVLLLLTIPLMWTAIFFILATSIVEDCYPFDQTLTHEVGHYIGLGHTTYINSIMNPTVHRALPHVCLSIDDINGTQSLYDLDSNLTTGTCVSESHISGLGEVLIYSIGPIITYMLLLLLWSWLVFKGKIKITG